ncbi:hypothetical protein JCM8097_005024 [Rhodosporidiobolus ruineniae]
MPLTHTHHSPTRTASHTFHLLTLLVLLYIRSAFPSPASALPFAAVPSTLPRPSSAAGWLRSYADRRFERAGQRLGRRSEWSDVDGEGEDEDDVDEEDWDETSDGTEGGSAPSGAWSASSTSATTSPGQPTPAWSAGSGNVLAGGSTPLTAAAGSSTSTTTTSPSSAVADQAVVGSPSSSAPIPSATSVWGPSTTPSASPVPLSVSSSWSSAPSPSSTPQFFAATSLPGSSSSDCAILDALYVSLGGLHWINTSGWATAKEGEGRCCEYYGVRCNKTGRVRALDLRGNGLDGRLDERVFQLGALSRLNLSENALSGPLPDLFASTPQLKAVYLSSNQLSGPLPSSLLNSSALVYLHLSNNTFTFDPSSSPASDGLAFPNAVNLSTLYLDANNLTGALSPTLFGGATNPKLSKIVLDGNGFSGALPDFGDLSGVAILSVRGNRFGGEVRNLDKAVKLVKLDLSSNSLTGAYPDPSALSKLSYLSLTSNAFTSPFPSSSSPSALFPSSCHIDRPLPLAQCPSSAALADPNSLASVCGVVCGDDLDGEVGMSGAEGGKGRVARAQPTGRSLVGGGGAGVGAAADYGAVYSFAAEAGRKRTQSARWRVLVPLLFGVVAI